MFWSKPKTPLRLHLGVLFSELRSITLFYILLLVIISL